MMQGMRTKDEKEGGLMDGSARDADAVSKRREEIDDLLSGTFNSILRIEEQSLDNRLTHGLTITEVHTLSLIHI